METSKKSTEANHLTLIHGDIPEQLRGLADQIEALDTKPYCFGICMLWIDEKRHWDAEGFAPESKSALELILHFFAGFYEKLKVGKQDPPPHGPH